MNICDLRKLAQSLFLGRPALMLKKYSFYSILLNNGTVSHQVIYWYSVYFCGIHNFVIPSVPKRSYTLIEGEKATLDLLIFYNTKL